MKDDNAGANNSVPMTAVEQIVDEKVEQRLSELGIEIRSEGEQAGLEDIWVAGQPVGKIIESNRKKADNATKQTRGAGSSDPEGGVSTEETESQNDETTLERIADDEQDDPAGVRITPSIDRAAAIMKHWRKWSDKAPKGRTIKAGLKTLIETVTEESLAWRQVYRACKKAEQLTKGKLVFTKTERHGWMLLEPKGRTSSAGAGG